MKKGLIAFLFTLLLISVTYAETEVTEGYDENTEVTIRGTMKESLSGVRGPLILILQAGSRDYRVITGPQWFMAEQELEFKAGSSYEVTGSKYISRDGDLSIVASRVKDLLTGRTIPLRDSSGRPLWRGHGMRRGMSPRS